MRSVLETRLEWIPARATLARVREMSGGNPLFALELAHALRGRGEPTPGEPLPVPDRLRDLVRARLRRIPPAQRDVLVHAAALRHPTVEALREAAPRDALEAVEAAEAAGLAERRSGRVTFVHPLFSSVLYAGVRGSRRRALHRRLANVVSDREERVLHLALASDRPDEAVAAALEEAAELARARGAAEMAAELAYM